MEPLTQSMIDELEVRLLADSEIAPKFVRLFDDREPTVDDDADVIRVAEWNTWRAQARGFAVTRESEERFAAMSPARQLLTLLALVEEWGDEAIPLELIHRCGFERDHERFLVDGVTARADTLRTDTSDMAIDEIPPDDLTDEQREQCEAAADTLRGAGYLVRVVAWDGNPFVARAKRQRADLMAALHTEALSINATLTAIRALPVVRSSTGKRQASSRRSRVSLARAPDRPRLRLSAAGREALADDELAAKLFDALADADDVAHPLLHRTDAERWRFLLDFARNRLGLRAPDGESDTVSDNERACPCGCGSFVPGRANQRYKDAGCRKRAERQRKNGPGL